MGGEDNKRRRKWQHYSGSKASIAENYLLENFQKLFKGTDYSIRSKPKEFQKIYVNILLHPNELKAIYNPTESIKYHGILPDYAINNNVTNKIIYVEVKRQDGWVKKGKRSDGRGNAHERSCKFFTPGLLKIFREKAKFNHQPYPFGQFFKVI